MSLSAVQPAITAPARSVPHVTIPAPPESAAPLAETHAGSALRSALRSAKGEYRSDAAAPPTAAQASDTFSFGDLLDIVNPLQHIPGVSWVYQHLTGDTIKPAENVAGGFLYGGPLGGMLALAMSSWQELDSASAAQMDAQPIALAAADRKAAGKFGGAAVPAASSLA